MPTLWPFQTLSCATLKASSSSRIASFKRELLNPPLRGRVGSLEPGKDADLVLWTADPLTTIGAEAYCTIVDGKVVYQAE